MSLLVAKRLAFTYPGRSEPALRGVDLVIEAGTVTLLQGPSGGGKTTLLRALAGAIPHSRGGALAGAVELGGRDTREIDHARLGLDVGLLFQDPESQAVMVSVWRDVAFAPQNAGRPAATVRADVEEALSAVGAEHLAHRRIDELSSGERQRVALAGILAARPLALLLDEPTSQLDAQGAKELARVARSLADSGTAIVIGEHRADDFAAVADRALWIEDGRLGAPPDPAVPEVPFPSNAGPIRAQLSGVGAGHGERAVLAGCDLELRAGSVTALTGPNGSGKTTLLRVLAGLHAPASGAVLIDGADVTDRPIEARVPALGFLPQDPGRHLLCETVDDEIEHSLHALALGRAARRRHASLAVTAAGLSRFSDRHPHDLSVGERERVALAAVLAPEPGVILLDEPTRGMDPARKRELADELRRRAAGGAAVLVSTHDAAFATAVADRRLRIASGRLESVGEPTPVVSA